jgi:hypothetical protein
MHNRHVLWFPELVTRLGAGLPRWDLLRRRRKAFRKADLHASIAQTQRRVGPENSDIVRMALELAARSEFQGRFAAAFIDGYAAMRLRRRRQADMARSSGGTPSDGARRVGR